MKIIIWGIALGLLLYGEVQAKELAIIVNKSYPPNSITIGILKDIYRGEKRTEGPLKIRPTDQTESAIQKKFLEKALSTTVDSYNSYWIKKIFQDGGVPPAKKKSSSEVIEAVSQEAGAIGYAWKNEVEGKGEIKVLLTLEAGD